MSWFDTLLPASFRGVEAEVLRVKDTGENALSEHAYPYRNGADVENFGRGAHKINVDFVLWGEDYEPRLKSLVAAFEVIAAGELVHPIFGSMQCNAKSWEVSHSFEEYDYCTVTVAFVEANADMPFFNRSLPNALAGLAGLQCMQTCDALLTQFEGYMDMAQAYLGEGGQAVALLRGYWDRLTTPLFELKSGVSRLGGDVFALPRQAFGDVLALFGALHDNADGQSISAAQVDAVPQTVAGTGVVMYPSSSAYAPLYSRDAVLREVFKNQSAVQDVLTGNLETSVKTVAVVAAGQPKAEASEASVKAVFNASTNAAALVYAASAVAAVFEWELVDPTLSPQQVEAALNQVRRPLQAAVVDVKSAFYGRGGVDLAQELQDLAWQLTAAARAVIYQRPAVVQHVVTADTSLHLLAHFLYGNYRRAAELARLNHTKNPNVVLRGEVLNVYAS